MNKRNTGLLLAVTCVLLIGPPGAEAGAEPPVIGSYDCRETVVEDRGAGIHLFVRLFNRGDAPVADAVVTLEDSLARGEVLGSFDDVSIGAREIADLEGRFALPEEEIDHLRKGGTPRLYLRLGEGEEAVRLRIELRREPLIREERP